MRLNPTSVIAFAILVLPFPAILAEDIADRAKTQAPHDVVWEKPVDIASRNLLYGPGGEQGQPHGTMTFVEEDREGSNPKIEVRDQDGTTWKVKFGIEARPETVASRLMWAAGFYSDQDYFVSALEVDNIPANLLRGRDLIGPGGHLQNVRLERHVNGEEKLGQWRWKKNPLLGTREFNGLRVMMALMNNWDVKDVNTAIYEENADPSRRIYVVSDLGATFGTTGYSWTQARSKGNLKSYSQSKFISKVAPDYVDFNVPTRPAWINFFSVGTFFKRVRMRWIGKHIPRDDARWMGRVLATLSPGQIRDAFRAGGYSSQEVEEFAQVVERRIAELNRL